MRTRVVVVAWAALLITPAVAQVKVSSGHTLAPTVVDDSAGYALIAHGKPLQFTATGPGKLQFTMRVDIPDGTPKHATRVALHQDGVRIRQLVVESEPDGRWVGRTGSKPGGPRFLEINVPTDRHRITFEVTTAGHALAVNWSWSGKDDEVPLAGLGGPPADDDDVPLAGLGGAPADDDVPLAGLGGTPPPDTTPPPDGGDVTLVSLTPPPPPVALADDDDGPGRAPGDDFVAPEDAGTLSVAPLTDGGRPPPILPPEVEDGPPAMVLAIRGLFATQTAGTGPQGGGVTAWMRPGFAGGQLVFGVSADLARHASRSIGRTVEVSTLPIVAEAAWLPPPNGELRWKAALGAGISLTSANLSQTTGSAVLPAISLSGGPIVPIGFGHLTFDLRWHLVPGTVTSSSGSTLADGLLGGVALGAGYQLEL